MSAQSIWSEIDSAGLQEACSQTPAGLPLVSKGEDYHPSTMPGRGLSPGRTLCLPTGTYACLLLPAA